MTHNPELVLGTVQLGIPYGRTNTLGQPSESQSFEILEKAISLGITTFDTARAYGDSEQRIGNYIHKAQQHPEIISKLLPLTVDQASNSNTIKNAWQASLDESLKQLGIPKLHVMMAHRVGDLFHAEHTGLNFLRELKAKGIISHIGVSIQSPGELEALIPFTDITHIQLPVNILDHRWSRLITTDSSLSSRHYYARSCYLQGLLLEENLNRWPVIHGLNTREILEQLDQWVTSFNRESREDLCIAYVRSISWVDGIVLGVATTNQLEENHTLVEKPTLSQKQVSEIQERFPNLPEQLLNPSQWD